MKKRMRGIALTVLMSLSLLVPAQAAETALGPDVIWLPEGGEPSVYNRELNWLTCKVSDNSYYVVDLKSQTVVEEYEAVSPFIDGLARVAKKNGAGNWRYGYIDLSGKPVVSLKYETANFFSEQRGAVGSGGKYGYIDPKGEEVIPLTWDRAGNFSGGLAWVGRKNADGVMKGGYIDKHGKLKIPPEWDDAWEFSDGVAKVGARDADGKMKYGYIDKTGAVAVPIKYDYLGDFSEGLAVARVDDGVAKKWGFVDKSGTEVVPLKYDYVYDFSEGLAAVRQVGADGTWAWGFVDKTGAEVIPPSPDHNFTGSNESFSDGLVAVGREEPDGARKWWFIDKTGRQVISLTGAYYDVGAFRELPFGKLAAVFNYDATNKTWSVGFVDSTGKEIIPPEWSDIWTFTNQWALASKQNDEGKEEWICIDRTGAAVGQMKFDAIGDVEEGIVKDGVPTQGVPAPDERCMYWVRRGDAYGYFEVSEQMGKPVSQQNPDAGESAGPIPVPGEGQRERAAGEETGRPSSFPGGGAVVGGAAVIAGGAVGALLWKKKKRPAN